MQISDKLRNAIAMSLTSIGGEEAEKIATKCGISTDTVYRQWRRIKAGQPVEVNDVTLELGELAAQRKKEAAGTHKRLRAIEKQMLKDVA